MGAPGDITAPVGRVGPRLGNGDPFPGQWAPPGEMGVPQALCPALGYWGATEELHPKHWGALLGSVGIVILVPPFWGPPLTPCFPTAGVFPAEHPEEHGVHVSPGAQLPDRQGHPQPVPVLPPPEVLPGRNVQGRCEVVWARVPRSWDPPPPQTLLRDPGGVLVGLGMFLFLAGIWEGFGAVEGTAGCETFPPWSYRGVG